MFGKRPALTAGIVFGVAAALPYLSHANVCGALYAIAGFVAAVSFRGRPAHPSDGLILGARTGVFGAAALIVASLLGLAFGYDPKAEMIPAFMDQFGYPDAEPGVGARAAMRAADYAITAVWFVALAALGSLVGVFVFRRQGSEDA